MLRSVLLLLAMLAAGICHAQAPATRSLCDLTTDAQASDGKSFLIRALYASTFHGAVVTDVACHSVRANAILSPGYKVSASTLKTLNGITRREKEADIIFHAVFRAAHKEQCFGQNCEPFQVEIDNIVSAAADPLDHPANSGLSHEAPGHAQSSSAP